VRRELGLRAGWNLNDTGGMVLLERDLPLSLLAEYADQARQGTGRVVLVAGEAGVGKSALLEQFAAGLTDARWYWGHVTGSSRRARWERSLMSLASLAAGWSRCTGRRPRGMSFSPHC
jgi:hypothetical protein